MQLVVESSRAVRAIYDETIDLSTLPEDLAPEELATVLAEVARFRRDRLVRLIARAIARQIHGSREP